MRITHIFSLLVSFAKKDCVGVSTLFQRPETHTFVAELLKMTKISLSPKIPKKYLSYPEKYGKFKSGNLFGTFSGENSEKVEKAIFSVLICGRFK